MFRRILGGAAILGMAVVGLVHLGVAEGGTVALARAQNETLATTGPVHHWDVDAREPMLVEHPDGTLFVAGYGRDLATTEQPPRLWKSTDGGATWERVDVGTVADGAKGNSDVDLHVGTDGTLYLAAMGFERSVGEGTHVAVGVSRDVGATWEWRFVTRDRLVDRPWVRETPAGSLHVIWNDGSGVGFATSHDAGRSWEARPRVHPLGGSSHMAVGPAGELAVRVTPISASGSRFDADVELIAVSRDDGTSWSKHRPPGERDWSPNLADPVASSRWVEPLAWDAEGALFYLWCEADAVRLARSTDDGVTWQTWTVTRNTGPNFFPYLAARGPGELAATWFSGKGDGLRVNVARIDVDADTDSAPRVALSTPFPQDAWIGEGDGRMRDPAGEYVPVAFLRDGTLGVVTPIQNGSDGRGGFSWWRFERR